MAMESEAATVLVLEDYDDLRRLLKEYLEGAGYRCMAAESVEAAHRLLTERTIDAAVIDLMMPVEPGSVIAIELMSKGIPVIVLTGLSRGTAASQVPHGMLILEKPVDLEVLDAALRERIIPV